MNISIVHLYPFPIGLAATNRILAYSKGMCNSDANLTVYCLNPYTEKGEGIINKEGVYEGVKYQYFINPYRAKYNFLHKIQLLWSILLSVFFFYRKFKSKESGNHCIIISTENRVLLKLYSHIAKLTHAKSIFIFDEYPAEIRYMDSPIQVNKLKKKYNKALKDVSGFVSIVETLEEFYNSDLHKPCLIFPTITDISKFSLCNELPRNPVVCYMGSLDLKKDNVQLIIEAFAQIYADYDGIEFHIYGKANREDLILINNTIDNYSLYNKVLLKGQVSFEKVPSILASSILLVSSQVDSPRIRGGLSTKLGEYLYSGTPVLLSNVGSINEYVHDNEHLFLVEPNDVSLYAQKMKFILDDYDHALEVANNGKNYILKNSSHIIMGQKLLNFINLL